MGIHEEMDGAVAFFLRVGEDAIRALKILLQACICFVFFLTPSLPAFSTMERSHTHELIVLVHGLLRTPLSMSSLKSYFEKQGYQTYSYHYPSTKYSIHESAEHLHQTIQSLMTQNPGIKVHFIAHSLGSIITREALSQLTPKELSTVGGFVMLAPPNQGSQLAKWMTKTLPFVRYFIKPLAELSSDENSYVHQVPIPKVNMLIIAGKYDAKAPPASTILKGQREPIVINAAHTFIMNHAKAKEIIADFLKKEALF